MYDSVKNDKAEENSMKQSKVFQMVFLQEKPHLDQFHRHKENIDQHPLWKDQTWPNQSINKQQKMSWKKGWLKLLTFKPL